MSSVSLSNGCGEKGQVAGGFLNAWHRIAEAAWAGPGGRPAPGTCLLRVFQESFDLSLQIKKFCRYIKIDFSLEICLIADACLHIMNQA